MVSKLIPFSVSYLADFVQKELLMMLILYWVITYLVLLFTSQICNKLVFHIRSNFVAPLSFVFVLGKGETDVISGTQVSPARVPACKEVCVSNRIWFGSDPILGATWNAHHLRFMVYPMISINSVTVWGHVDAKPSSSGWCICDYMSVCKPYRYTRSYDQLLMTPCWSLLVQQSEQQNIFPSACNRC